MDEIQKTKSDENIELDRIQVNKKFKPIEKPIMQQPVCSA